MTLRDQFEPDLAAVFFDLDDFAENINYESQLIPAIIDILKETDFENNPKGGKSTFDVIQVQIRTNIIVNPKKLDTFVYKTITWEVEEVSTEVEGAVEIIARRKKGVNFVVRS